MHCCQEGLRNTRLVTSQSESSQMRLGVRRLELLARCITYEIHKHRDTCFVKDTFFGRTGEIVTLLVVCRS